MVITAALGISEHTPQWCLPAISTATMGSW